MDAMLIMLSGLVGSARCNLNTAWVRSSGPRTLCRGSARSNLRPQSSQIRSRSSTRPDIDPLYAHDILVLLQRLLVHVTPVPTKCAVVDEAVHPTVPACDRQNVTTYERQR